MKKSKFIIVEITNCEDAFDTIVAKRFIPMILLSEIPYNLEDTEHMIEYKKKYNLPMDYRILDMNVSYSSYDGAMFYINRFKKENCNVSTGGNSQIITIYNID